jgi:hypothetical protein
VSVMCPSSWQSGVLNMCPCCSCCCCCCCLSCSQEEVTALREAAGAAVQEELQQATSTIAQLQVRLIRQLVISWNRDPQKRTPGLPDALVWW